MRPNLLIFVQFWWNVSTCVHKTLPQCDAPPNPSIWKILNPPLRSFLCCITYLSYLWFGVDVDDIPIVLDDQAPRIESLHRENSLVEKGLDEKKDEKSKTEEKLRKNEMKKLWKSNSKDRPGNFNFNVFIVFFSFPLLFWFCLCSYHLECLIIDSPIILSPLRKLVVWYSFYCKDGNSDRTKHSVWKYNNADLIFSV